MREPIDLGPHLQAHLADDGVAELVFGPEGSMPATDTRAHAELGSIWQRLQAEPGVRAILVRSVGKGFCAGGTPDVVQSMLDSQAAGLRVMQEGRAIVQGMIDCDLPIVSAINGAAVGAGAAVALLADVSIAGHRAKIIDGAEAERIGLVSLAVPDDQLLDKAREVARQLAAGSPTALAVTKRSWNHWLRAAWPAFEHSLALEILGFAGGDARQGVAAVNARRPARFETRA